MRTDDDYKYRRDKNFHQPQYQNEQMALETVGINMISQFPFGCYASHWFGCYEKIILALLHSCTIVGTISRKPQQEMSSYLTSLCPFIPQEFSRKPRTLYDILRWKSTEFRQFLLYTGLIVFKKFTNEIFWEHFLLLSCSYRLLMSKNCEKFEINLANSLLEKFVQKFPRIYGESSVTHNVHNLLHLKDIASQFGSLSDITAYPFENMMNLWKEL